MGLTKERKKEIDLYREEDIYYFWSVFTEKELDYIKMKELDYIKMKDNK